MTTREEIIAAAKEVDPSINDATVDFLDEDGIEKLTKFYAIAFEAGRQAERKECASYFDNASKVTDVNSRANTRHIYIAVATSIRARSTK